MAKKEKNFTSKVVWSKISPTTIFTYACITNQAGQEKGKDKQILYLICKYGL